jgi:hypothetical protein
MSEQRILNTLDDLMSRACVPIQIDDMCLGPLDRARWLVWRHAEQEAEIRRLTAEIEQLHTGPSEYFWTTDDRGDEHYNRRTCTRIGTVSRALSLAAGWDFWSDFTTGTAKSRDLARVLVEFSTRYINK